MINRFSDETCPLFYPLNPSKLRDSKETIVAIKNLNPTAGQHFYKQYVHVTY